MHFTLKTNSLRRSDLDEFVKCYKPENRHQRKAIWSDKKPNGRWRSYNYDELVSRDKAGLGILGSGRYCLTFPNGGYLGRFFTLA